MDTITDIVPKNTYYCYDIVNVISPEKGIKIKPCKFWGCYFDEESWEYIYKCDYLNEFDKKYETTLIWDQVKCCEINYPKEYEYENDI